MASVLLCAGCADDGRAGPSWELYARIVAVEDARGELPPAELVGLARSADAPIRSWAVRGLGRLGDPDLATEVAPFLEDPDPAVRVEAAHALASLESPEATGAGAFGLLRAAAADPAEDAGVRASFAHALVRSARRPAEYAAADTILAELVHDPALRVPQGEAADGRLAVARAWELRSREGLGGWREDVAVPALVALAATADAGDSPVAVRTRRLVVAALRARDALRPGLLDEALGDRDPGVRRQAVLALSADPPSPEEAARLVARLEDPEPTVRLEALRGYGRWLRAEGGCGPLLAAVADPDPHVALVALDLLGAPCPGERERQRSVLVDALDGDDPDPAGWHRTVGALVALAAVAPEEARARVAPAASHPNPFVRARVAAAATRLGHARLLRSLARDESPNVRTAAVRGLGGLVGHGADSLYRAQLASDDPQLVLAAVGLLEGTPDTAATAEAMTISLQRFTETRTETVRDVRMALLEGLGELGGPDPEALRPLATDYDPVVAARATELLEALGGPRVDPRPRPLARLPTPEAAELEALSRTTVVLEMARGGEIRILLRPDWAATNAARCARLAREGWFDGLTFHRVAPNFVIQGGSPGANEYAGADLYTRDELGRPGHWEGTVGLSTRGRDTGDAQIFVNLVDNPRLDFRYTVFGEVVEGVEVARAVLEGDVILRAHLEVAEEGGGGVR